MKIIFVSNYINHHQIPFCEAMIKRIGEGNEFYFIQTEEMESDRKDMGWGGALPDYVLTTYESEESAKRCRDLIRESEVVIFGGSRDEALLTPRLEDIRHDKNLWKDRLTFRYSERLYREGQWKFISPRGLIRKFKDHTRYRGCPVYLLCAGAFVSSDFDLVMAYPDKKLKWGYFTEVNEYDTDALMREKGYETGNGNKVPYILWAGRFLKLKRAEFAVRTAEKLKDSGIAFHMDIIGGGEEEENLKALVKELSLEDRVGFPGFKKPEEVRRYMEKADIFLFTSNRLEGWGAVVNEAMNSGCALIAGNMPGAAPSLIRNGVNGYVFRDNEPGDIYKYAEGLISDPDRRRQMGIMAYKTMKEIWNPDVAADKLMDFTESYFAGKPQPAARSREQIIDPPCSPVKKGGERKIALEALRNE